MLLVCMQYYIFLVSQPDSSCFLITQVPCQVSWHKHVHEAGNTTNTSFTSSPYTRFRTLCYTTTDIFVTHLKLHCFVLREISNKPEKKKKETSVCSFLNLLGQDEQKKSPRALILHNFMLACTKQCPPVMLLTAYPAACRTSSTHRQCWRSHLAPRQASLTPYTPYITSWSTQHKCFGKLEPVLTMPCNTDHNFISKNNVH